MEKIISLIALILIVILDKFLFGEWMTVWDLIAIIAIGDMLDIVSNKIKSKK